MWNYCATRQWKDLYFPQFHCERYRRAKLNRNNKMADNSSGGNTTAAGGVCSLGHQLAMNVAFTFFCLLGATTNVLILLVLRSKQFPATSSFTFMAGQAVYDLLACVGSIPMGVLECSIFTQQEFWVMRFYLCFLYYPLVRTFAACSIYTTLTMSVDRIVQLKIPTLYMGTRPARRAGVVLVGLYVALQALHFPFFFGYRIARDGTIPQTKWRQSAQFPVFMWIATVMVKMAPLVFVIPCNVWLTKLVIKFHKRRQRLISDRKSVRADRVCGGGEAGGQLRVSAMLLSVSLVYLACHVAEPFSHHAIYNAINGPNSDYTAGFRHFQIAMRVLEMVSYSTNLFPYVVCNPLFRGVLLADVFRCSHRRQVATGSGSARDDENTGSHLRTQATSVPMPRCDWRHLRRCRGVTDVICANAEVWLTSYVTMPRCD